MAISTSNTYQLGEIISDNQDTYYVSFYRLEGIPVRCITGMYDETPVGIIFHILGHGDWIYFNSNTVAINSTIPRILNLYTEEIQPIFVKAINQARYLMLCIHASKMYD